MNPNAEDALIDLLGELLGPITPELADQAMKNMKAGLVNLKEALVEVNAPKKGADDAMRGLISFVGNWKNRKLPFRLNASANVFVEIAVYAAVFDKPFAEVMELYTKTVKNGALMEAAKKEGALS